MNSESNGNSSVKQKRKPKTISIKNLHDLEDLLKLAAKYRLKRVKFGEVELDIDTFVVAAESTSADSLDNLIKPKLKLEDASRDADLDMFWSASK